MVFVVPTVIAGWLWGDWIGGFLYAGMARLFFVQQSTFCVNSLAHHFGESPFDDRHTPRDHFLTSLLSLGEGYHNFHHEFPSDYRNTIRFFQYDPTKWLIWLLSFTPLAYNLKRFPMNEISKGQVMMKQKEINKIMKTIDWGVPLSDLPFYTLEEFEYQVKEKKKSWLVINDIIYDVEEWQSKHPGGTSIIHKSIGQDVTHAFTGGIYSHSNAAKHLLMNMNVGKIQRSIPEYGK
jgi:stearoyl-CoA desaturase (delta-9 desaturase)